MKIFEGGEKFGAKVEVFTLPETQFNKGVHRNLKLPFPGSTAFQGSNSDVKADEYIAVLLVTNTC